MGRVHKRTLRAGILEWVFDRGQSYIFIPFGFDKYIISPDNTGCYIVTASEWFFWYYIL